MTDEMKILRTLLEKSSDADLLREMVGFAAHRLMELEVESVTGAAHGERSPDRINHRNERGGEGAGASGRDCPAAGNQLGGKSLWCIAFNAEQIIWARKTHCLRRRLGAGRV